MKTNRQKRSNNKDFAEIFGTHAVNAALKNNKRNHQKLFISQNQKESIDKNILKLVPEVNELHNKEMFKMFGSDSTHQGIVLRTSKLEQPNLEEILLKSENKKNDPLLPKKVLDL